MAGAGRPGRFITHRDTDSQLGQEENSRKAVERAELMATGELITWDEMLRRWATDA